MSQPRGSRPLATSDETALVSIRYEPIAEIGAGGMGSVSLARATTGPAAGSFVAIKRLYPHLEKEPAVAEAFLDELWLTSSLHHPSVVEPLDWGRDELGSYLVMQFVPGDSLRALTRAREMAQRPVPIEVVVEIIARAAEGLHAAHELKNENGDPLDLVHRDISPANVLVGFDGSVKLIDFGVAKAAGKLAKTQSGLIKGKYSYMSPEQIQGRSLDRRSDIFSLGVVAWETLTLCRLYNAATEFEILRMVSDEPPVPPSELRTDVPARLDAIVLRCLAKAPDARFETCAELARELAPMRPSAERARKLIANLAREALPERLAWIERRTSVPVAIGEQPLAVEPDATVRTESIGEQTAERLANPPLGTADTAPFTEPPTVAVVPAQAMPSGEGRAAPGERISRAELLLGGLRALANDPRARRVGSVMRQNAIMIALLGAIGMLAMIVGAWLGSR